MYVSVYIKRVRASVYECMSVYKSLYANFYFFLFLNIYCASAYVLISRFACKSAEEKQKVGPKTTKLQNGHY